MSDKNLYIVNVRGRQIDLTHAATVRGNNLYPFGRHNYSIYLTPEGEYVLGTNAHSPEHMLDTYALIDKQAADGYKHPYIRRDDSEVLQGWFFDISNFQNNGYTVRNKR